MSSERSEVRVDSIERRSWCLALAFLLASLPLRSLQVSGGLALGAFLAIVNFRGIRSFASFLAGSGLRRPPRVLGLLYLFKYVLTGVAIFFAIKYDLADVIALLMGVSVIFLAVCWEGISAHMRMKEGEDHAAKL